MLGTFFVYTLALSMPIFKKKSRLKRLGKSSKLWGLHKKSFLCNTQSLELFPRNLRKDFFLKIGILHPCPAQNSVYHASHCSSSTLIIGCVNLFGCLYSYHQILKLNQRLNNEVNGHIS